MLVPRIITKNKLDVIDGEIVQVKGGEFEELCEYSIDDFTEEAIRSFILAGHRDYFTDSEILTLRQSGLLNKFSWSEICSLIQNGSFSQYFGAGDYKEIVLNLDTTYFSEAVVGTYRAVVIGINHNSEYEGTNRVHFCIGQKAVSVSILSSSTYVADTCFKLRKMNSTDTNEGGWAGSELRSFLNGAFYDALPSDLKAVITPSIKYTDNVGNSSNLEGNVTVTEDKIFLFSEFEVYGNRTYANEYEQTKQARYQYYIDGKSRKRDLWKQTPQAQYNISGGTPWWLRSPSYSSSSDFCNVNNNKNLIQDAGNSVTTSSSSADLGVAPCFVIWGKPFPNLTLSSYSVVTSFFNSSSVSYSYLGDGQISYEIPDDNSETFKDKISVNIYSDSIQFSSNWSAISGTVRIIVSETDNYVSEYKDVSVTFTLQI